MKRMGSPAEGRITHKPRVITQTGYFGGGKYPKIPVTVKILDFSLPEGHCVIGGREYRTVYDPRELERIVYPDGSRPTACALVPVEPRGSS